MADYIYTDDGLLHETNELKHYGILGMKWGVRRYQTKNGTLTKAGKRRYEKEVAKAKDEARILRNKQITANKFKKLEEMKAKNKAKKNVLDGKGEEETSTKIKKASKTEAHKKAMSEMTNDEIRAKIERIRLENELRGLTPEKVSAGKKFMDASMDVLKNSAQQVLTDTGKAAVNKWLGLDEGDFKKFEKKSKMAEFKKKIAESEMAERKNRKEKEKDDADAAAAKAKADKEARDKARKEKHGYMDGGYRGTHNRSTDDGSDTYTVSGVGTSSRSKKRGPVYDADYTDVDSPETKRLAIGRTAVAGLLDDPRKKKKR